MKSNLQDQLSISEGLSSMSPSSNLKTIMSDDEPRSRGQRSVKSPIKYPKSPVIKQKSFKKKAAVSYEVQDLS